MREPSPAWGQAADDPQSVAAREAPVWEKKHAPRAEPGFFGAPGDLPPRGQAGQGPPLRLFGQTPYWQQAGPVHTGVLAGPFADQNLCSHCSGCKVKAGRAAEGCRQGRPEIEFPSKAQPPDLSLGQGEADPAVARPHSHQMQEPRAWPLSRKCRCLGPDVGAAVENEHPCPPQASRVPTGSWRQPRRMAAPPPGGCQEEGRRVLVAFRNSRDEENSSKAFSREGFSLIRWNLIVSWQRGEPVNILRELNLKFRTQ